MASLEELACCGGLRFGVEGENWLLLTGASSEDRESGWLLADPDWVRSVLPASNELELLRRTAIRDPLYRFHLDVLVSQVLQAVARFERWARLEELLAGPFLSFAPRFLQLLKMASTFNSVDSRELTDSSWAMLARQVEGMDADTFLAWDDLLWGQAHGGASAIFPILTDLYAPLVERAINVNSIIEALDARAEQLLAHLIAYGRTSEGVFLSGDDQHMVEILCQKGLPIRIWNRQEGAERRSLAGIVAPIRLISVITPPEQRLDGTVLSCVDRDTLGSSALVHADKDRPKCLREGIWSAWETGRGPVATESLASLGFVSRIVGWPRTKEEVPEAPPGASVPPLESIKITERRSQEADQALALLGRHVLFGFMLQVFLIEALDRELNKETLILAPPQDHKVDDIVNATVVLYRPSVEMAGEEKSALPEYNLGDFGEVMERVAADIGILGVPEPFTIRRHEPWPAALQLMWSAGLVTPKHYGWAIDEEILDRLHGGGLMTGVLRRGQDLRKEVHASLYKLWEEKHRAVQDRREAVSA